MVLGILAAAESSALAQTGFTGFGGSVLIVDRSGADCDSVSAQTNELHTGVFRPVQAGVSAASLQLFQNQIAFRMEPSAGGSFAASGSYSARIFAGHGGYFEYTGTYRKFKFTPKSPSGTTQNLSISGMIANFRDAGDCTVTFNGGFVLKN